MNERTPQFETNPHPREQDSPLTGAFQIVRLKVKEKFTGNNANVLRCVLTNGTVEGKQDYFVKKSSDHVVDDNLIAFQPLGGTDAVYHEKPVTWQEMGGGGDKLPPGGVKGQALMVTDDAGTKTWAYPFFVVLS